MGNETHTKNSLMCVCITVLHNEMKSHRGDDLTLLDNTVVRIKIHRKFYHCIVYIANRIMNIYQEDKYQLSTNDVDKNRQIRCITEIVGYITYVTLHFEKMLVIIYGTLIVLYQFRLLLFVDYSASL